MNRVKNWEECIIPEKLKYAHVNVYYVRCIDSKKKWQIKLDRWYNMTEFYIGFAKTSMRTNPSLNNLPITPKTVINRVGEIKNYNNEYNQILLIPKNCASSEIIGKFIAFNKHINDLLSIKETIPNFREELSELFNGYKDSLEQTICYSINKNSFIVYSGETIAVDPGINKLVNSLLNLGTVGKNITKEQDPKLFNGVSSYEIDGKTTKTDSQSLILYNGFLINKLSDRVIETRMMNDTQSGSHYIEGNYTMWVLSGNTYIRNMCINIKNGLFQADENTTFNSKFLGQHIRDAKKYNGAIFKIQ